MPYPRKQWLGWYTELDRHYPSESKLMEMDEVFDMQLPNFELKGPDDLESLQVIREFFAKNFTKQKGFMESYEENGKPLNPNCTIHMIFQQNYLMLN